MCTACLRRAICTMMARPDAIAPRASPQARPDAPLWARVRHRADDRPYKAGAPDVLPGPDASLVVAGRVMAGVARAQGAYCAPCSACGLVFRGDPSVVRTGARGDAFSDGAAQAEDCEVIPEANTLCN